MSKLITVIIPVYNGEDFIERCLDSVICQDVDRDIVEILVIDDGSRDESVKKINRYVRKNPKLITFIKKSNSGAADTRNLGISMVKTEFLTFLDQDDWLDTDFLRKNLSAASDDVDIIQGGFNLCDSKGKKIKKIYPVATEFGKFLAIPAWAKVYRTSFLMKNKIKFFDNNIGEDNVFTMHVIKKARCYKTIRYSGYNNYFDNVSSVTNSFHKGLSPKVNFMKLMNELCRISKDDRLFEYNMIRTAYYYLLSYGRYATSERFIEVSNEIDNWFSINGIDVYRNKYLWCGLNGEKVFVRLGICIFLIVKKIRLIKIFAIIYTKGV